MNKCKRKEILDCIFLTKNNTEEFKKAYEKHYKKENEKYTYKCVGEVFIVKLKNENKEFFFYNKWYVFCENKCKEYNIDEFSKLYSVID